MINLLITIDAEGFGIPPNRNCFYGECDGKEYGIRKIMDISEKYNMVLTFFLDIYELNIHGILFFTDLCKEIRYRGHDIQLHTHPAWQFDIKREFMSQYSQNEQREIILWGMEKINKLFGNYPIAYRAGSYNINKNTFEVLKETCIEFDNSIYHGHFYNKGNFDDKKIKMNVADQYNEIVTIPLTLYKFMREIKISNIEFYKPNLPISNKYRKIKYKKLDINIINPDEFDSVVNSLVEKTDFITLFMHSFSFIKNTRDKKVIRPYESDLIKYEMLLKKIVNNKNINVITFSHIKLMKETKTLNLKRDSILPQYKEEVSINATNISCSNLLNVLRYRSSFHSNI